jgi:two-component system, NtrC family, response regulator HydG
LDTNTTIGAHALIGRPMAEVERFYCEKALELSGGNREEAAKMLGIGERTLYRNIQKWKLQDGIKKAMLEHPDDTKAMAKSLGITETDLKRELKKLGAEEDDGKED